MHAYAHTYDLEMSLYLSIKLTGISKQLYREVKVL